MKTITKTKLIAGAALLSLAGVAAAATAGLPGDGAVDSAVPVSKVDRVRKEPKVEVVHRTKHVQGEPRTASGAAAPVPAPAVAVRSAAGAQVAPASVPGSSGGPAGGADDDSPGSEPSYEDDSDDDRYEDDDFGEHGDGDDDEEDESDDD